MKTHMRTFYQMLLGPQHISELESSVNEELKSLQNDHNHIIDVVYYPKQTSWTAFAIIKYEYIREI